MHICLQLVCFYILNILTLTATFTLLKLPLFWPRILSYLPGRPGSFADGWQDWWGFARIFLNHYCTVFFLLQDWGCQFKERAMMQSVTLIQPSQGCTLSPYLTTVTPTVYLQQTQCDITLPSLLPVHPGRQSLCAARPRAWIVLHLSGGSNYRGQQNFLTQDMCLFSFYYFETGSPCVA